MSPNESDWHRLFRQNEEQIAKVMGCPMQPSTPLVDPIDVPREDVKPTAPPPTGIQMIKENAEAKLKAVLAVASNQVKPEPPRMKDEWEKEIDAYILTRGGEFEVQLPDSKIKVTAKPDPKSSVVEITPDEFKRLSRCAVFFGGRVVRAEKKEVSDKKVEDLIARKLGFWAADHCFIEIDPEKVKVVDNGGHSPDGIVHHPAPPTEYPAIDPLKWISISAGIIRSQRPMRSGPKVIGTLLDTIHGPLWVRNVGPTDHKLYVQSEWARRGGYTIEKDVFHEYLSKPGTVIKIIRPDLIFFTTSAHIQKYAGVIVSWGKERIVMPISGMYWLVTDHRGEVHNEY